MKFLKMYIIQYVLDSIFEYLRSTFNGNNSTADVFIYCRNGVLPTHRLVLASISKLLLSMLKGDSWNEPITMILADFDIEEVVEYFNDFYKQGYHSERFLSLKNILGVKGFSYMNHEDFEKIADANFRERNVCTGIAEEAAVKVIENESLTLKTEVIKNDGACNNYEDNDEIDETL